MGGVVPGWAILTGLVEGVGFSYQTPYKSATAITESLSDLRVCDLQAPCTAIRGEAQLAVAVFADFRHSTDTYTLGDLRCSVSKIGATANSRLILQLVMSLHLWPHDNCSVIFAARPCLGRADRAYWKPGQVKFLSAHYCL